jgi:two-component system cell cycle sensor histidine kinase/response regulator CckA
MHRRDDTTESWPLVAHVLSTVRVRFKDNPTARPPRVLVVDDEESVRRFAEAALAGAGYEVTVAFDGLDALRVVDKHAPFDLFVIDVMMPRMTGDELARQLRQSDPDVKVLYLTGDAEQVKGQVPLSEHEALLEKPVTTRDLTEAASRLLFGHQRGPQSAKR